MTAKKSKYILTNYVPLILNVQEKFCFAAKHILRILRDFSRGQRAFWPLNCPEHREEEFWGQKGWGPLENYQKMHHDMFCPRQKNTPLHFQNQRYIHLIFMSQREKERGGREKEEEREREKIVGNYIS
jgi:hypothetical protein